MIDARKKLEETKVAIRLIKSMSWSIPEEELEIQEILERLIAAEEKHPRDFGKQFVEDALRTESPPNADVLDRLTSNARLLHAAMGLCTEAGEFLDALKKHIFYGKILDTVNIVEECGDFLWYLAIVSSELDCPIETIMVKVINKLKRRYADKFTSSEAIERDLDSERKELEKKVRQVTPNEVKRLQVQRYKIAHWDDRPVDPNARYFVLRLDQGCENVDHLVACRLAALTYAKAVRHTDMEQLGLDLIDWAGIPRESMIEERDIDNDKN